jgi:hypothetical protein
MLRRRENLCSFWLSNLNFLVVHPIPNPSSINTEWIQHVAMFVGLKVMVWSENLKGREITWKI